MTQDSIYNLTFNSVKRFTQSIRERMPDAIKIESSMSVTNTYLNYKEDENPKPILTIELQGHESSTRFVYNTNLEEFAHSVCDTFREGIKSMNSIDLIERRLLEDFYKSEPVLKLKNPVLSEDEPKIPTDEERRKGAIPDENMWVWNGFAEMRDMIFKSIEGPQAYLDLFTRYSNEISLDSDE